MLESQLNALIQRVRRTLESGLSVAVIGWRDSNHDEFTRGLSPEKVIFLDNSPGTLAEKIGLVLFTRFVRHKTVARLKKNKEVFPHILQNGQIKTVLESVLLVDSQHSPPEGVAPEIASGALDQLRSLKSLTQ